MYRIALQVSIDDNFPDKMCSKCVRVLRIAYKFRLTCQRSHQHIADMLSTELDTSFGGGNEDEAEDEAIAHAWEEQTQIKIEGDVEETSGEFINYVVSGDDADEDGEGDVDAIVFDATNSVEEQSTVVYDDTTVVEVAEAEVETETEVENFADYEELEVLASESLPQSSSTEQNKIATQQIVWSEVPDDDMKHDILSSDDESYLPEVKAQPRLLNRVRQPRKVHLRSKTTSASLDGVHEEKKMGRKPRDKHSNYICDVCGNIYPSQARLTEHMKFHSGVKPHECE